MKIIARPRAGGKTSALIEWVFEDERRVLVVAHSAQVHRERFEKRLIAGSCPASAARERAQRQVIGVGEFILRRVRYGSKVEVAFDEVDAILAAVFGGTPTAATFTGEVDVETAMTGAAR